MIKTERGNESLTRTKSGGISTAHIVIALVIPLIAYFGLAAGQKAIEVYQLNQDAAQVRADTEGLKAENARLLALIEYLKSDAYIEKIAREQLNLVKPGDKAVVVLAPEGKPQVGDRAQSPIDNTIAKPNWRQWWDFFFGATK
ncbi:MAG: septum formation initiator family protein [Dehalococcoidia bacterium]|nr:septum formation initiator family protein [Dehalococcoidia bacterium]